MILDIGFTRELYLWLLLLLPLVLFLVLAAVQHSRKLNSLFFQGEPQAKTLRYIALVLFATLAYCNLVLALSGPQMTKLRSRAAHENVQVVVGIDISKSMLAEDVAIDAKPEPAFPTSNRLNLARKFALELVGKMQGERTGIFFFADKGVQMVPLTRDYGFINYILKHTGTSQLAIPGSNLVNALQTGLDMLEQDKDELLNKIIIISDGEDTRNDAAKLRDSLESLDIDHMGISCVGTGKKENSLIPVRNDGNIQDFYQNQEGQYLQTRQNEDNLRLIASSGSYYHLTGSNYKNIAGDIYNDIESLGKTTGKKLSPQVKEKTTVNLAPIFMLAGLLMCTCYFIL